MRSYQRHGFANRGLRTVRALIETLARSSPPRPEEDEHLGGARRGVRMHIRMRLAGQSPVRRTRLARIGTKDVLRSVRPAQDRPEAIEVASFGAGDWRGIRAHAGVSCGAEDFFLDGRRNSAAGR